MSKLLTFDELNATLDNKDLKQCERCLVKEMYCIHAPLFKMYSWGEKREEPKGYFHTIMNRVLSKGLCEKCEIEINKLKYDEDVKNHIRMNR